MTVLYQASRGHCVDVNIAVNSKKKSIDAFFIVHVTKLEVAIFRGTGTKISISQAGYCCMLWLIIAVVLSAIIAADYKKKKQPKNCINQKSGQSAK